MEELVQQLSDQIGTETHIGDWLEISQDRINKFADVTEDHQWIHVNPERAARESPYGGTVAHGFLTLSLIPFLTKAVSPEEPRFAGSKMSVNYGLNRVRFPNAVRVGDRIRTRTVLQEVEALNGAIQIVNKITVEVEGQEKPACVAEMVSRHYF